MITSTHQKRVFRRSTHGEATRLIAIRAIVDAAATEEDHDVVAEALLVLGASRQEIVAAMLELSN